MILCVSKVTGSHVDYLGEWFHDTVIGKITRDTSDSFVVKVQAREDEELTMGGFEDEKEEIESF